MIRNMELKDIEEIKEIDKLCFKGNALRITEGIRGYIKESDCASIVYEIDDKVVGFNFIHIWGSFAWFGPFGVHPEYQGRGIGKALIEQTIKVLKEDYKVSTIGLNTMPESQYNLGFYMNLGFTPLKLSLNLKKQLSLGELPEFQYKNKFTFEELDINDEISYVELKENLKSISNKISSSIDLTSELYLIKNEGFGTVFTLKFDDKICGIVICYKKSKRTDSLKDFHIKLAIIDTSIECKEAIDEIVNYCTEYAGRIKYESMSIDCNTYNSEICNYLIKKYNFKIEKTQVMMLMGEENIFKSKNVIVLTRLAG